MTELFSDLLEVDAPFIQSSGLLVDDERAPPAADGGVRVVLGVLSPVVSFGLAAVVRGTPGVTLASTACSLERMLTLCRDARDCVALADLALSPQGAAEFMRHLNAAAPRARAILISEAHKPHAVREAMRSGACGFLEKTAPPSEIRAALVAAARGQRYLTPGIASQLADSLMLQDLTARETDVVQLLARGECNKVIARELSVTLGTVKTHVHAILGKLSSRSRTDAVLKAHRLGLVRIS